MYLLTYLNAPKVYEVNKKNIATKPTDFELTNKRDTVIEY